VEPADSGSFSTRTSTTMGSFAGKAVFTGGPWSLLRNANLNPASSKTTTVTSASKAFCRTRCYWRISRVIRIIGPCLALPSHRPASSLPLSGIGLDQIASSIKFLRFFEADWRSSPAIDSFSLGRCSTLAKDTGVPRPTDLPFLMRIEFFLQTWIRGKF
jgi:hypothetical protein